MIKRAKHYLIPHKGNGYKPHLLTPKGFGIVALVVFALFFISTLQMKLITQNGWLSAILPSVLIDDANASREDSNLPDLKYSTVLERAAQLKANDMAEKGYFAHNSPEGVNPWHWFREAGYDFVYAGENLAVNFYDSEPVHEAWMNSPGHRANILSPNFTEIGIATKEGVYEGRNTIFVVQEFGSPLPNLDFNKTLTTKPVTQTTVAVKPVTKPKINTTTSVTTSNSPIKGPITLKTISENDLFIAVQAQDKDGTPLALLPLTKGASSINDSSLKPESESKNSYPAWLAKLLISPERTLGIAYIVLAVIITLVLLATIFVEIKRQHPYHILVGILLLIFIAVFFYLTKSFALSGVLIV